jgi:hypothetical protein
MKQIGFVKFSSSKSLAGLLESVLHIKLKFDPSWLKLVDITASRPLEPAAGYLYLYMLGPTTISERIFGIWVY